MRKELRKFCFSIAHMASGRAYERSHKKSMLRRREPAVETFRVNDVSGVDVRLKVDMREGTVLIRKRAFTYYGTDACRH